MNVLIISDDSELSSFDEILSLKQAIQRLHVKVDTLILSSGGIFWNKSGKRDITAIKLLADLLHEKDLDLIGVSLTVANLEQLCIVRPSILDLVEQISPQTDFFIFGASSVLTKIEKDRKTKIFLYKRRGVAKITNEFRMNLLDRINKRQNRLGPQDSTISQDHNTL